MRLKSSCLICEVLQEPSFQLGGMNPQWLLAEEGCLDVSLVLEVSCSFIVERLIRANSVVELAALEFNLE